MTHETPLIFEQPGPAFPPVPVPVLIPELDLGDGPPMEPTRLFACPDPFRLARIDRVCLAGASLLDILTNAGLRDRADLVDLRVSVDGSEPIPEASWATYYPAPGSLITARAVPRGGGGEGGGKNTGRMVAMIAVMALAIATQQLWLGTIADKLIHIGLFATMKTAEFAVNLGIALATMGAMMAVNAIFPPPMPKLPQLTGLGAEPAAARSNTLSGARNQANPYGPIPKILGKHKVTPPYAALPYTENAGDDQYLRCLFTVGYGPLVVRDIKIGETSINEFNDVEMEIRRGEATDDAITLYPGQVVEENLSVALNEVDGFQLRTTGFDADEISIDVSFPQGLCQYSGYGSRGAVTVDFEVQYAATGTTAWSMGMAYQAFDQRVSPEINPPADEMIWHPARGGQIQSESWWESVPPPLRKRTDRVVIGKATGEISVLAGTPADEDDQGYPPIPDWAAPVARVIRRYGETAIVAADIIDERDDRLDRKTPGDFLPSAAEPAANRVVIAAGEQKLGLRFTAAQAGTIRKSMRFPVPRGQYDVRIRRVTPDNDNMQVMDDAYWTALRTIRQGKPVLVPGLALIGLRVRATDQLNGSLDTVSCIAESIVPDWDGTAWAPRPTNNPASLYREVLQGPGNKRAVADDRLDLAAFQAWHDYCHAKGYAYNAAVDYRTSVQDLLQEIAAAGRAVACYVDGKHSIIWEKPQSVPVQHFTPRNSWGFGSSRRYNQPLHGLRVIFPNEEKDFRQDERIVYDDGFSKENATRIEKLELPGITEPDLAWMHGRYHLAGLKLRPEEYSFMADVEHLVCTKGDLVRVSHDVPLWGLGWGRVRSVEDNGATVTAVHLDEALAMEAGKEYCVRFRNADGASKLVNIVFQEGSSKTIVPQDPLPPAEGPQAGDLAMFGERGRESALLLIRSIEPQADLTARIVAVDAAPEILQADQGPIPAFDSLITAPSDVLAGVGVPAITNIQSDERALIRDTAGILRPRILISLRPVSDLFTDQIQRLEVQWRLTGSDGPWQRFESPRYTTQVVIDQVESGVDYDLRLRWILFDGRPGNWALRPGYRVVGVTSPPPDVPGLMIQDGRLTWWYPQPPIDLAGFEVRWRPGSNPTWDSASPAHEGVITLNRFDVGAFGPGPKTFLVKARDVAGNVSLSPAVVMTDLGDQVVDNVVIATDHQALNWPGDIQNGVVENGVVEADDIGTRVWTGNPSVRVFTGDPAHRFWESPHQTLVYSFSHVVDLEEPISGRPLPDPGLVIDLEAEGTEIRTEYRPDGVARVWSGNVGQKVWTGNPSAPAWSPLPAFMPWPGRISLNQRRRYDFRITIAGGMVQGRITALAVWIDVPDREESIEDAAVSASGTRLALVQDYLKITVVNLTLQDDGGTARTLRVVDKNPAGPLIEALDGSGNRTTAVVDARIQGF